jgi:predicted O-methyltransferase YrrM
VTSWDQADLAAMAVLAPLSRSYVPWSEWAMRPAGLVEVLNHVALHRPAVAVECGSGVSTIYLARLFAELGRGRTVAIEHDGAWAAWLRERLADEGLGAHAEVVHAPLGPDGWYDEGRVLDAVGGAAIELLLVDGPPAAPGFGPPTSREPALGFFLAALAPGALVVLDDAGRSGEQEVLRRWDERYGLRFAAGPGGIATTRSSARRPDPGSP